MAFVAVPWPHGEGLSPEANKGPLKKQPDPFVDLTAFY